MIPETDRLIQKTINAGIPADQAKEENSTQLALAMGLKREFFPSAP